MVNPELSVIIPVMNEAQALPRLLDDLACQLGLSFEVLIIDGGSVDGTAESASDWLANRGLEGRCLMTARGRGKQLNEGIKASVGEWFLLLHADSRIHDPRQLCSALNFLIAVQRENGTSNIAGRFALKFDGGEATNRLGFYFYETKARLGRPGTIHGDQGMLLNKTFFERVGPFREDLPVMEDCSLAEKIRNEGYWQLLPGEIVTSSRRFLAEGLKERQTLNALMMNFLSIGWLDFFHKAPDVYRQQSAANRLQLKPFFYLISSLLDAMPFKQRWQLWYATGAYVRSQAWQIGLFLDCRKAYQKGTESPDYYWMTWFDHWFDRVTDHCVGRFITAILVRFWFKLQ